MSADIEQWDPPNDPTAFESLCLDLWRDIWQDDGAQKHGRRGQAQSGVDVFGSKHGSWIGVQCKQKDGLLRTTLTVQELDDEVRGAMLFRPSLSVFVLATTGRRNAAVQARARALSDEHRRHGQFTVEVWSWDEIWRELYARKPLLQRIAQTYWPRLSGLPARRGVISKARSTRPDSIMSSRQSATDYLLDWLRRDQDKRGVHSGEFGKHAPIREERQFQSAPTDLATKPRLYLTGWPCFVFCELGFSDAALHLAIKGVRRQLAAGSVRALATIPSHPEHLSTVENIRHTFRALQILHRLTPDDPLVVRVLGEVLDPRRLLQQADGGWPHFAGRKRSDLWATTYGTSLLHSVETASTLRLGEPNDAHERVRAALVFLKHEWERTRWAYAEASSAHNAVQIYHELAVCLRGVDPSFLDELISWVLQWITPSGMLSASYLDACDHVTWPSANARVAYAIFQYSIDDRRWRVLFEEAMREIAVGINGADAAFLLHMAQHFWNRT